MREKYLVAAYLFSQHFPFSLLYRTGIFFANFFFPLSFMKFFFMYE